MEATNSLDDHELAPKLERLFQMFVRAQEEWTGEALPVKSDDDGEKEANVSI